MSEIPEEMRQELTYDGRIQVHFKYYNYQDDLNLKANVDHWMTEFKRSWPKEHVEKTIRMIRRGDYSLVGND